MPSDRNTIVQPSFSDGFCLDRRSPISKPATATIMISRLLRSNAPDPAVAVAACLPPRITKSTGTQTATKASRGA